MNNGQNNPHSEVIFLCLWSFIPGTNTNKTQKHRWSFSAGNRQMSRNAWAPGPSVVGNMSHHHAGIPKHEHPWALIFKIPLAKCESWKISNNYHFNSYGPHGCLCSYRFSCCCCGRLLRWSLMLLSPCCCLPSCWSSSVTHWEAAQHHKHSTFKAVAIFSLIVSCRQLKMVGENGW